MSALARADAMAALWVHTSELGSALLMVQGRARAREDSLVWLLVHLSVQQLVRPSALVSASPCRSDTG
jgi:uncharacterized protein (DUF2062 family)